VNYHPSQRVQDGLADAEMTITNLIKGNVGFRKQLDIYGDLLRMKHLPEPLQLTISPIQLAEVEHHLVEREAQTRIAFKYLALSEDLQLKSKLNDRAKELGQAAGFAMPLNREDETPTEVERKILNSKEFGWVVNYLTEADPVPWVLPEVRRQKRSTAGIGAPPTPPADAQPPRPMPQRSSE
jgi:hypothetical protein